MQTWPALFNEITDITVVQAKIAGQPHNIMKSLEQQLDKRLQQFNRDYQCTITKLEHPIAIGGMPVL